MIQRLKITTILVGCSLLLLIVAAFQANAAPTPTTNGLLQFTSQSDFESAFPGLPKEDFEESPIGSGLVDICTGPIDNTTNQPPNCFVPWDILDGLSIDSDPGHQPRIVGIGYASLTTTSVTLASHPLSDILSISFSGPEIYAVGMDLAAGTAGGTYQVKVYGAGNTLLETITSPAATTSGVFFGLYSPQPITKITLDNGINEFVDNIQFGGTASTLTFYTDQSTFEAAHPGLPVEDFEESPVADTTLVVFAQPLDKTTNAPGAFVPGDILDDLHIQTITSTATATALQVVGDNFLGSMGNSSKVVCDGPGGTDLDVRFFNQTASEVEIDTYAVGMDLWQWAPAVSLPRNSVVVVYDMLGRILGTTTVSIAAGQGNFFGVSSNQVIIKITFQLLGPDTECIDNIQYGGSVEGLTFYRTKDDFKKARSNLPVEDFSESPVPDATPVACSEPIDSTTNEAGCFAPGDILPNITFQTENSLNPACPNCLVVYGANMPTVGNTTPMITVSPPDLLELAFSGKNVHFTGLSMYSINIFSIYGPNDTLLGTSIRYPAVPPLLGFWGVESTKPISRITIWGGPALVNEVMFGGKFPWSMYRAAMTKGIE